MDSEDKFWAWIWGLCAIVIVVGISCITYYNTETYRTAIELAKLGVNPAVIKCMDVNWSSTGNHDICKAILTGTGLTIEDTRELIEKMQE